ncbi:MAG: endonuclease/exonuclease/phosphatase family protein [bacterium]
MKLYKSIIHIVIFLFFILHSSFYVLKAQDSQATTTSELKIMTFNIRYGTADDGENSWQFRYKNVFEVIKKYEPDILGLQEALKFQIDEIKAALPEYEHIGFGRDDGKEAGEYSAILYKRNKFSVDTSSTFWFSDTPDLPGSKHWGNNITRICTWADFLCINDSSKISFYNVHLDHESQLARINSTKMLMKKLASRIKFTPTIITGDFNATENSDELKEMRFRYLHSDDKGNTDDKFYLKDCFRMLHSRLDSIGTFQSFTGNPNGDRIDYIFVSNKFDIIESNIVRDSFEGRYPSDHFPVTAMVKLKK